MFNRDKGFLYIRFGFFFVHRPFLEIFLFFITRWKDYDLKALDGHNNDSQLSNDILTINILPDYKFRVFQITTSKKPVKN